MILALNLGNTRLRAAIFADGPEPIARAEMPSAAMGERATSFLLGLGKKPTQIGIASVVPSLLPGLLGGCRTAFGVEPKLLSAATQRLVRVAYPSPETLGADRLAAALAAEETFPGKKVLIADFGTATTYTLLDEKGTLQGGMIFPGARLALESLSRGTGQLPKAELSQTAPALVANSTVGALQAGVYHSQLFTLRGIVQELAPERVVLTGGGASAFAAAMPDARLDPDLVLRGLRRFISSAGD